jgi:formate hydrogenlyase subunit 4
MFPIASIAHVVLALLLAPLLPGVINRTKAWFAGRRGPRLAQTYFDLWKLLHKGAVYSRTTNWVFAAGPIVGLACVVTAMLIVPLGGVPGFLAFSGDFLLLACLLGLMRFFTVIAALDTGSSFEGMGGSREVFFSALAEPAMLLGLTALAASSQSLSLSSIYALIGTQASLSSAGPAMLLVAAALGIVFLTENARIPIDDPNTHLELTMIHEVMVLDHGGPDLAMIEYGSAVKLWVLGALLVGIVVPVRSGHGAVDLLAGVGGMVLLAVFTGVVESTMARLKLLRVPQFLVAAAVLSILALVLVMR